MVSRVNYKFSYHVRVRTSFANADRDLKTWIVWRPKREKLNEYLRSPKNKETQVLGKYNLRNYLFSKRKSQTYFA